MEQLSTADCFLGAFRSIIDGWFYSLEEDVLAEGNIDPSDDVPLARRADELLEQRLVEITRATPQFAAALRTYRSAQRQNDHATAEGLAGWLAGQPHVAASIKRAAGIKGDVDHFAALSFLRRLLLILKDSGYSGLVLVLDEIETLQRVRGDVRKTEAAFFPVLSQMLSESWAGLSVPYVSPIKALLNNQEHRLARSFQLVGRRAACWHGDTPQGEKRRTVAAPPDCLLTTPESLEAILVSTKIDHAHFFHHVRTVVVDELHTFAADDRGWHLLSVFTSAPLFRVVSGQKELGSVHESTFYKREDGPVILVLAVRTWKTNHLDWKRRVAHLEPSDDRGRSRWLGEGQMLSYHLCQSIRRVLAAVEQAPFWSSRTTACLEELRSEYSWASAEATSIVRDPNGEIRWWTFGGGIANALLADYLRTQVDARGDNLAIKFPATAAVDSVVELVAGIVAEDVHPVPNATAIENMKFSECLSPELADEVFCARFNDVEAVRRHATPVGSGTVARTKRIPVEQRAAAAVFAWMRHQTTGYDGMAIPKVKGQRREVRRRLARRSQELLSGYRRGEPAPAGCPLQEALRRPPPTSDRAPA